MSVKDQITRGKSPLIPRGSSQAHRCYIVNPEAQPSSDSGEDPDKTGSLHIIEANVLQERTIGVFGAVSLVVNKIVGAGYGTRSLHIEATVLTRTVSFPRLALFLSFLAVLEWP